MIRIRHQKITIIRSRKPISKDINRELQWVGTSLGLFNPRDRDKSCFRVFIELLKSTKRKIAVSSDELAFKLNLSRGTVIHHTNKLIDSGLVVHEGRRYLLRVENLMSLIDEVERDIHRNLEDLRKVAIELDQKLGL